MPAIIAPTQRIQDLAYMPRDAMNAREIHPMVQEQFKTMMQTMMVCVMQMKYSDAPILLLAIMPNLPPRRTQVAYCL
jgi:hypothetical protein